MTELVAGNAQVAAATFEQHWLDWSRTGRPAELGISVKPIDDLRWVATLTGRRTGGGQDPYHLMLDVQYYDLHPPVIRLVVPPSDDDGSEPWGWLEAAAGSEHWPRLACSPSWFGLHGNYAYEDGVSRQLLCFSFNADYYRTGHRPMPHQAWQQGRHTVAASLTRMAEVLAPPYLLGPDGPAS